METIRKLMQEANIYQLLVGAAAATTVIAGLFALANNYIINRITLAITVSMAEIKDDILETMKQDYVTQKELALMREAAADSHRRLERELRELREQH